MRFAAAILLPGLLALASPPARGADGGHAAQPRIDAASAGGSCLLDRAAPPDGSSPPPGAHGPCAVDPRCRGLLLPDAPPGRAPSAESSPPPTPAHAVETPSLGP